MIIPLNNLIYICFPDMKFYNEEQRRIFLLAIILPMCIELVSGIILISIFLSRYYSNEEIINLDKLDNYIDNIKNCQLNNSLIINSYEINNKKYCLYSTNDVIVNISNILAPITECINETYIKDNMMKHINSFDCEELTQNFIFGISLITIYLIFNIICIGTSYRTYHYRIILQRNLDEMRQRIELRQRMVDVLYRSHYGMNTDEIDDEIRRRMTDILHSSQLGMNVIYNETIEEVIEEVREEIEIKSAILKKLSGESCSICLETISEEIFCIGCKHEFHNECLELWLRRSNTCPLCRNEIKFIQKNIV